ncbi:replication initiation protein [Aureimonas ureilytica]|uniref:replication initiation protein n=1 Tax=Aureimonas ureilytica TaxID=401562 RepID=UPI0009EC8CD3|nr:replication initiation protein [Aureimonas ureilytica]
MGKTLQVIADRAHDKDRSYRPGELVEGRFDDLTNPPGIVALKLYELMLREAGAALAEDRWHTLDVAAIKAEAGIKNLTRRELVDLFKELAGAVMEYRSGSKIMVGSLLETAEIETEDGPAVARWRFGTAFRYLAERSDIWAVIDRSTALSMTSRYGLRLHEMIALRANLDHKTSETFTLPDLRGRLGVPKGKLTTWNNLNQFALKPAVDEVNRVSRFAVSAVPKKRGRAVVGVEISWSVRTHGAEIEADPAPSRPQLAPTPLEEAISEAKKAPQKRVEPKPAPDTGKAPKTRQRASKAEKRDHPPGWEFPASGGIRYNEFWSGVARAYLPTPTPDLDMMADKFRAWVIGPSIPLKGPHVLSAFQRFCSSEKPPK